MAAFDFQTKSFVIWEPSVLKSRFLLNTIRDTAAWVPGTFFFNLQSPSIIWPQDPPWGSWTIVLDKKLFTNSYQAYYMVQIPIKYDQINPSILKYEKKYLDIIKHEGMDFHLLISRQNPLLFENQVCWKADFFFTTSGTLQPATLGCFLQPYKALPLFDLGIHPEDLGILWWTKNYFMI